MTSEIPSERVSSQTQSRTANLPTLRTTLAHRLIAESGGLIALLSISCADDTDARSDGANGSAYDGARSLIGTGPPRGAARALPGSSTLEQSDTIAI